MNKKELGVENQQKICRLYKTGKYQMKELSKIFGCSVYIIKKILLENNIQINRNPCRASIKIKEDFFENIDSEEKAYFLGFLLTDGNIYLKKGKNNKNYYEISLEIAYKDIHILKTLKKVLNINNKISYRKRGNSEFVKLSFNSNKIAHDLNKYGITPNKTKKINKLPEIQHQFQRHFIRGLLDGDGGIYYNILNKKYYWHITFCSYNYSVCQEFQERCNYLLGIKENPAKILKDKNCNIYRVHYNKKELVKQLVTILYEDSHYYLIRKYNLFREIVNEEDIV